MGHCPAVSRSASWHRSGPSGEFLGASSTCLWHAYAHVRGAGVPFREYAARSRAPCAGVHGACVRAALLNEVPRCDSNGGRCDACMAVASTAFVIRPGRDESASRPVPSEVRSLRYEVRSLLPLGRVVAACRRLTRDLLFGRATSSVRSACRRAGRCRSGGWISVTDQIGPSPPGRLPRLPGPAAGRPEFPGRPGARCRRSGHPAR